MKFTKKFRVVPYVSHQLQKPSENYVENLDNNMTRIIKDKNLPDDYKIKLYHQNLNKFLMKYDPESYGVAPSITKLVKVVGDYLEKKNTIELIDRDLKTVFKENFKKEVSSENEEENDENKKKLSYLAKNSFNKGSDLIEKSIERNNLEFNDNYYRFNPNYSLFNNESYINNDSDLNSDSIYPSATKISRNTRSQTEATHPEGLQTVSRNIKKVTEPKDQFEEEEKNRKKSAKTARTPPNKNVNTLERNSFFNSKPSINNKYRNSPDFKKLEKNNASSRRDTEPKKQGGAGHLYWSTWKN